MAVFVSYSHQDSAEVDRVAGELLKRNVKVWRDVWKNAPGDAFADQIESALNQSTSACFFISRHSMTSEWVARELGLALSRASRDPAFLLVPVLLDDTAVPPSLETRLAVDFRHGSEATLGRLLSAVEAAESKPPKGRLALEGRYFTHFGIEERQGSDVHVVLLDVVSFDIEETYCVLSQFEFRVTGERAWTTLELAGPDEIKTYLLRTCAEEFARRPAVVKLTARDAHHARFSMSDAAGAALVQASVRITVLGEGPRAILVFNAGVLIDQACRALGYLPPVAPSERDQRR